VAAHATGGGKQLLLPSDEVTFDAMFGEVLDLVGLSEPAAAEARAAAMGLFKVDETAIAAGEGGAGGSGGTAAVGGVAMLHAASHTIRQHFRCAGMRRLEELFPVQVRALHVRAAAVAAQEAGGTGAGSAEPAALEAAAEAAAAALRAEEGRRKRSEHNRGGRAERGGGKRSAKKRARRAAEAMARAAAAAVHAAADAGRAAEGAAGVAAAASATRGPALPPVAPAFEVVVVSACSADLSAIAAIDCGSFGPEECSSWSEGDLHSSSGKGGSLLLVARRLGGASAVADGAGAEVVGFVACEARGALRKLAVWPERARRHGIGRALLRAALAEMKRGGVLAARLHVDTSNLRALALYESSGFVRDGSVIRDYYAPGLHAWRMLLDL